MKKPANISAELLTSVTENARVKAEILCKTSGNALEQLLNIDYNRGKLNVFSGTSCDVESGIQPFMAMSRCTAPEIEPDDIDELKEKMDAVWQLLSSFCQGAAAPSGLFDSCESLLFSVKKEGTKPECLGFQGLSDLVL